MPLGFPSINKGTIAFGFFNIDTDLLILEHYFLSVFSRKTFQGLIQYVWQGGYPRWKEGIRPSYVIDMKEKIEGSMNWLLTGIQFDA